MGHVRRTKLTLQLTSHSAQKVIIQLSAADVGSCESYRLIPLRVLGGSLWNKNCYEFSAKI